MLCMRAQLLQLYLTLCIPRDCSPPTSCFYGIVQARIVEWVSMPSSRRSSQPRNRTRVSCISGRFFNHWATREAPIQARVTLLISSLLKASLRSSSLFYYFFCFLWFIYHHFLFFFNFFFYVGVRPINNVVIVSDGQQRDSATHTTWIHSPPNSPPVQAAT